MFFSWILLMFFFKSEVKSHSTISLLGTQMDNRGIAISLWFWCGKWDYSACCSSNCYQPIDRTCINEHLVKEEEGILFCMHADLLADSLRWTFHAGIVSPLYCCNVSKAIPLSVHLQNAWRRCSLFCCFLRQITSRVRCVLSVVYCLLPAWWCDKTRTA